MGKRNVQKICLVFLLIAIVNTDSFANRRKPAKDWVRAGELGPKPKRVTDAFPSPDKLWGRLRGEIGITSEEEIQDFFIKDSFF